MVRVVGKYNICYEVEYGPGCKDCFGLGAVFVHVPSCDNDFCVGNGDEYACNGEWLPCEVCSTIVMANSDVTEQEAPADAHE